MNATRLHTAGILVLVAGLTACASARTLASRDAVATYNRCVVATKQADFDGYRRCQSAASLVRIDLKRSRLSEEAQPEDGVSPPVDRTSVGSAELPEQLPVVDLQQLDAPPVVEISRGEGAPDAESSGGAPLSEEQAWMRGLAQSAPYETRILEVVLSEDLRTATLQTRNRSGVLDQQMEHDETVVLVVENGRWVIDKDCCEYSNARFASP